MIALVALFIACVLGAPYQPDVVANDVAILNYALYLERFEASFYNFFQTKFTAAQFIAAGANANLYPHLEIIRAQENAHVTFLVSALGAAALPACTSYDFTSITTISDYVVSAKAIENAGVSAYDGAVNSISNRQLASIAATIATVEARHASYLNNISANFNAAAPFTDAFDPTTSEETVLDFVAASFAPQCSAPVPIFTSITIKPAESVITFANNTVVTGVSQAYLDANDVKVLQYALVLEHLENTFYAKYNSIFNTTSFTRAGVRNATLVSAYMRLIGAHEQTHVTFLSQGIGAGAVSGCGETYNWTAILNRNITTVNDFLLASATLESVGVGAYDYAISSLYNKALQEYAATIATVEARHAAFVNDIINPTSATAPFPGTRDTPLSFAQVAAAVLPILSNCYTNADIAKIQFDDIRSLISVNSSSTSAASTSTASTSTIATSTASTSSSVASTSATTAAVTSSSASASSSSASASTAASSTSSSATASTSSSTAATSTSVATTTTGTTRSDASSVTLSFVAILLAVAAML